MYALEPEQFSDYDIDNVNIVNRFIDYWSIIYDNDDIQLGVFGGDEIIDYFAELNVGNDLIPQNVINLLRWKDPRLLSHNANNPNPRVQRVLDRIIDLNGFRNGAITAEDFIAITGEIFNNGCVWRAFLFHICLPIEYPIIDQHVLRVYNLHTNANFIGNENLEDVWGEYGEFITYFNNLYDHYYVEPNNQTIERTKRIDNALMAFG